MTETSQSRTDSERDDTIQNQNDPRSLDVLAAEEPDAMKTVAERAGGELKELLYGILEEHHPEYLQPGFNKRLYVIEGREGSLKVGVSKQPQVRLRQLQTGHDVELSLLLSIDLPAPYEAEEKILQEYSDENSRGEWLQLDNSTREGLLNRLHRLNGMGSGG